jgi:hypothetical protein
MNFILKALLPAALIGASSIASSEPLAQLNLSWSFGAPLAESNSWQANALIGQQFDHQSAQLPLYQYSFKSDGTRSSQLLGAPAAKGMNPLNVDGGINFSTIMIMGGFIAAGLVIADELSEDETPPVEPAQANQ